jgi:predicted aspartyl protease
VASAVAFDYLKHLLTLPVRAAGIQTRFILDTGIGLNLISEALAARIGCQPDGSAFTGQRMSGQPVTIPLGTLSSLDIGEHVSGDVRVGIFDMHAMAGLEQVEGFLSLTRFRSLPMTIDYSAGLVILEDQASLSRRARRGTSVPVQVDDDSCSTRLLLPLELPSGRVITVEVDTGSEGVILDESLAADVGVDLHDQSIRVREGTDETGHHYARYFATASGDISVVGAPHCRVTAPGVMFQKIIYDGLVGDGFLRGFTTTYDVANERMIFSAVTG